MPRLTKREEDDLYDKFQIEVDHHLGHYVRGGKISKDAANAIMKRAETKVCAFLDVCMRHAYSPPPLLMSARSMVVS